jgi:hypothetical protein
MKILMTFALISLGLSACVPGGFRGQSSDNTDHFIQVGDIRMGYRTYGNGYPLVMIMGYGNTMRLWEPTLIRLLSSYYKLIISTIEAWGIPKRGSVHFLSNSSPMTPPD